MGLIMAKRLPSDIREIKVCFDTINARRLRLITKQHDGFTEEESARPYTTPGWKDECERRCAANLTMDERDELELLQRLSGHYLNILHPLPMPPMLDDIQRLARR